MTTQHSQQSTMSLSSFSTLTEDEILQVIQSCNPTTCPLYPIPSTMLQTITQDLLPFISTIINRSLTSGYVPTTFKQARVIPILKKPALDPSDINNYRPISLLSFLSKSLECTVFNHCLSISHKTTSMILISLGSKQHIPQRLLFWLFLKNCMLLGQPSCHLYLSSWIFLQHLTQSTTRHFCQPSRASVSAEQHGNGLLPTWKVAHTRYHSFRSDISMLDRHIFMATARNLGVTIDNELSFFPHVAYVARSCRIPLYNIRRIRPFLSTQAAQESPLTTMFVDDIVICGESKEQVEKSLERWRYVLERRGMKVIRSKTEYMCVNEREGSGGVQLQGEEVEKVEEFRYLASTE
ncbi:hypothetical protein HF521_012074 [Silurus meridionalis]|uniref:Reverse transcriptase domain-containing protein n=1 Tax=Silurus meridionalis TaxID=175797 RepID=A0A8T0ADS3_SILME|nr:hypothetical protein HF521_012074 [Silurus meridionalis]